MKYTSKFILIFILLPVLVSAQAFDAVFKNSNWLNEHLEDDNLVILHVDTEENYKSGHIPGAQFIKMNDFTITTKDSIRRELPTISHLDSLFRSYGISDKSKIVVYYGGDLFASAFRLYFTFDYLGMADKVFILDGGLKNWNINKLQTSSEVVKVTLTKAGDLTFKLNPSLIVDKNNVKEHIGSDNVKIIDARRDRFYSGETDGDGHYRRPGHIASAKNITWLNIVDENQNLKTEETLRKYFTDQGIENGSTVITYCHVGLRATVLYTISKSLGYSTKMYDGSYNEWDRLNDSYGVEYTYSKN